MEKQILAPWHSKCCYDVALQDEAYVCYNNCTVPIKVSMIAYCCDHRTWCQYELCQPKSWLTASTGQEFLDAKRSFSDENRMNFQIYLSNQNFRSLNLWSKRITRAVNWSRRATAIFWKQSWDRNSLSSIEKKNGIELNQQSSKWSSASEVHEGLEHNWND